MSMKGRCILCNKPSRSHYINIFCFCHKCWVDESKFVEIIQKNIANLTFKQKIYLKTYILQIEDRDERKNKLIEIFGKMKK